MSFSQVDTRALANILELTSFSMIVIFTNRSLRLYSIESPNLKSTDRQSAPKSAMFFASPRNVHFCKNKSRILRRSKAHLQTVTSNPRNHLRMKMGWEKVRRRRREEDRGLWGVGAGRNEEKAFAISVARAGGWGGGEEVGLGIVARVGMGQRGFVRGWSRDS